jgi:hypothetical protein
LVSPEVVMVLLLLALQSVQPMVVARPAPGIAAVTSAQRKRQMIADAGALLGKAEAANARYVPKVGGPSKAELDAQVEQMKTDLDSMSEMGEMETLRLQMAMDRMSKMMSTLSNLLKKISDTQGSITNNIK